MEAQGQASRGARELPREVAGFRLLRVLGKGGMGIVYEAEELASGRRVALKVLADELSVSEEAFERFRREARIAASVSDTSCVFVFGAHQVEGSPAIAMELCVGETLDHRIQTGDRVPVADAVRWTMQILDGLEAAHQAGVIHRDVKPSNCFLTAEGRIKVGDFGLARSLERDVQLTRSGVFLGSPLYAAPEQVRGRQVDLRSDLYSVGATLYAVLTGRSPYHGENLGEVLARILSEDCWWATAPRWRRARGLPSGTPTPCRSSPRRKASRPTTT
jgi:serine/threonine protein kinase